MKIKESNFDNWIYVILCILTLGSVWLIRVVISEAIRRAIENK